MTLAPAKSILDTVLTPSIPAPISTNYTAAQTYRFFINGLIRACWVGIVPMLWWAWSWEHNWAAMHWDEFGKQFAACFATPAGHYWLTHRKLLKLPKFMNVPDEFLPGPEKTK